jgi:hypothetical protein
MNEEMHDYLNNRLSERRNSSSEPFVLGRELTYGEELTVRSALFAASFARLLISISV